MNAPRPVEAREPTERAPVPAREMFFLVNRSSGEQSASVTVDLIRQKLGKDAEIHLMEKGDDLAAVVSDAIERGARIVVAAGGDGTVCGVASAVLGTDARMGVLPGGTFNFFARSLGIPDDMEEAIEVIRTGHALTVTLGEVNDRVFINNASLGVYALILNEREAIYRRWGRSRLAAYWSVVVAMATLYRPLTMRITIDGEVVRAKSPMAFVGISAHQLDEYRIEGADAIRSGKFAVLLAPDSGRFLLIWRALKIAMRGVRQGRDFTLLTGEDIVIETRRTHRLVARDGERERMAGPYRFRLTKDAVQVIRPR